MGARTLETGIWGAYKNVVINLAQINDADFKSRMTQAAEAIVHRAAQKCAEVLAILENR